MVEVSIEYVPKVKNDEMVDEVVNTIKTTARAANRGDGKIFIYDVREAIRIMTGETGEAAM
jgi:nitrogen regulatory protein P-II 1